MQWIWVKEETLNQYVEFVTEFTAETTDCKLQISADTEYVVWLNGKFIANGQYADYPYYKILDEIDLKMSTREGKNRLAVLVWHMGIDASIQYSKKPAVCFQVSDSQGRVLTESDENTLCRMSKTYRQGENYLITPQLGYAWSYDCTAEDGWKEQESNGFQPAVVVDTGYKIFPRPIPKCSVHDVLSSKIYAQGVFWEGNTKLKPAEKMQYAWLRSERFWDMTGQSRRFMDVWREPVSFRTEQGNGIYVIVDLETEWTGYPTIDIEVSENCMMYLGYGEHLNDLRVRTKMVERNFAFEVRLKKGRNHITEYTRRLGGRYLMIMVETRLFTLHQATIINCEYPLTEKGRKLKDDFLQRIYDTGIKTLKLCAHEHYEDCPWREQALYAMDSRNQMLYGYYTFEEYDYPRSNLRLMALSQREDGLLSLCAPARTDITIPSFSLYWIIALCENAEVDFKQEFVEEMLPYAHKIMEPFEKRLEKNGIGNFLGKEYWNFYEWADGLDGAAAFEGDENTEHGSFQIKEQEKTKDLILTTLFYLAATKLSNLENQLGLNDLGTLHMDMAQRARKAAEAFYCKDTGLYASFINDAGKYGLHGYTLSLLICSGIIPKSRQKKLGQILKFPSLELVPQTFSTLQWKYDAIMEVDGDIQYVLGDIRKVFGQFVLNGASTFPETQYGESDFEDAGSLCHAWSAVPCYILNRYYD